MARRCEGRLGRDWNFVLVAWNLCFRTAVNLSRTVLAGRLDYPSLSLFIFHLSPFNFHLSSTKTLGVRWMSNAAVKHRECLEIQKRIATAGSSTKTLNARWMSNRCCEPLRMSKESEKNRGGRVDYRSPFTLHLSPFTFQCRTFHTLPFTFHL